MAKKPTAKQLAARAKFAAAAKAGTLRKKKTAKKPRKKAAKKSVSRPSQITKKAPSARLKKRRAKPKVKGYFANPSGCIVFVVKSGKRQYLGDATAKGYSLTTKTKAHIFSKTEAEKLCKKIHGLAPRGVSAVGFEPKK